ncbi:hypothetical protein BUE80_DR011852 [Diplocarpon rosae]|nr:hypothetical protein BUE80_DR011852 [Diplocarpon rosae]
MAENNAIDATISGRLRGASVSTANALLNFKPQPGMWAATGIALAYAPNLTELREPLAGGENIEFNHHGHSSRTVVRDDSGAAVLAPARTQTQLFQSTKDARAGDASPTVQDDATISVPPQRRQTLAEQAQVPAEHQHNWRLATLHGLTAAGKFVSTPTGFLMTIYGLNIVAWGAMLFFLLLGAAPAMNHPSKDDDSSPRKKWIEIDSQILNALFCVTGFGLAPWRFRDLYWLIKVQWMKDRHAMKRLSEQNASWFRVPEWYHEGESENERRVTFTGQVAPPTRMWKLSFVIWMMIWNTLFQAVLAAMMWAYNRFDRPIDGKAKSQTSKEQAQLMVDVTFPKSELDTNIDVAIGRSPCVK